MSAVSQIPTQGRELGDAGAHLWLEGVKIIFLDINFMLEMNPKRLTLHQHGTSACKVQNEFRFDINTSTDVFCHSAIIPFRLQLKNKNV